MKNTWKKITLLVLAAALVVALAGCAGLEIEDDPAIRAATEVFLDALVADNGDAAYAAVYSGIDRTEFDTAFDQMCAFVDGVTDYTLEPIHYSYSNSNGVATIQMTYSMTAETGSYIVTAAKTEGYEGLMGIHIAPEEQTTLHHTGTLGNMAGANVIQWAVLILGILVGAFVIWMAVDCCRRKIRLKWLWLLMIVLGAMILTVTMNSGGINLRFNFGLYLQLSSLIRYGDGSMQLSLVIPVGAIAYCILRGRLPLPKQPQTQPEIVAPVPEECTKEE